MGTISGGIVVSNIMSSEQAQLTKNFYQNDDISWSEFFGSSLETLKGKFKREVRWLFCPFISYAMCSSMRYALP